MPQRRLDRSYALARQKFLESAQAGHARVESFPHPMTGLDGEELAIDVAQIGDPEADSVLVIVCGIHGVEGFTSSALQSWWLDERAGGLDATAPRVVLIHGLNPVGFSWVRRANEDNVDINRNFVDWSNPPVNVDYPEIAEALTPREWTELAQAESAGQLLAFAGNVGIEAMSQILIRGQYDYPAGVFYGGSGPAWSHRWLTEHLSALIGPATRLAIMLLHTGAGEWATGELTCREPNPNDWWQEMRALQNGTISERFGEWLETVDDATPGVEFSAATLEFGVVDLITALQALRADAWLYAYGDPTSTEAAAIRHQVRAAFADDDPAWLAKVIERFDEVTTVAVAGLSR
ncbi:MAG: DUF2817 domain-containing protein [Ilumatobacter sp.]